jgi:hypothetical protein
MRCYAGVNSVVPGVGSPAAGGNGSLPLIPCSFNSTDPAVPVCDDCASSVYLVNAYFVFNLGFNILIIVILKLGSSNILWLAMTFMVPLGNLAFYIPGVPGHTPFSVTDVLGLLVIMLGLVGYRYGDKVWERCHGGERGRSVSFVGDEREGEVSAAKQAARLVAPRGLLDVMGPQLQVLAAEHEFRLIKSPVQLRGGYYTRLGLRAPDGTPAKPKNIAGAYGAARTVRFASPPPRAARGVEREMGSPVAESTMTSR